MNYKSSAWKRKRLYILSRDDYECQESRRYGKTAVANTVHHIYPIEYYPELTYIDWNLLSVSESMHNTFHDRENNEITDKGKHWQRKFKRQFESHMEEFNNE